jgi:hypothetical protein
MFTPEEISNLLVFLRRVDLKGEEAMAFASLVVKIQMMGQQAQQQREPVPEDPNVPVDNPALNPGAEEAPAE